MGSVRSYLRVSGSGKRDRCRAEMMEELAADKPGQPGVELVCR